MQIAIRSYCVGLNLTNDAGEALVLQLSSDYAHRADAAAVLKQLSGGHPEAEVCELKETYDLTDPLGLREYQHHIQHLFNTCRSGAYSTGNNPG